MTDPNTSDTIGQSPNPADLKRRELEQLLPEAFSEGRLDLDAPKRALGEDAVIEGGERYRLDWAGKADAYKVLQTPSTATLRPQRELSVNLDEAQHVFIEGAARGPGGGGGGSRRRRRIRTPEIRRVEKGDD